MFASRLSKLLIATSAVLCVTASGAFAQTTQSPQQPTGGTTQQRMQQPTGQTGTMGMQNGMSATVSEINQQQRTVKLRMQNGESVQFQVPQQLISQLNQGDSVQVSIQKAQ